MSVVVVIVVVIMSRRTSMLPLKIAAERKTSFKYTYLPECMILFP